MRTSVTQEAQNGCGVACFAFACGISYEEAAKFLGPEQAASEGFLVKHLVAELGRFGKNYQAKHVKVGTTPIYQEGAIVLIRRSRRYPNAHYVVRHEGYWMDPWINFRRNWCLSRAKSGYRKRLPGQPWYVISPTSPS